MHECGFVHCDIKLDNVLINSNDFTDAESSLISIIDFGAAEHYLDQDRKHLTKTSIPNFVGNLAFSSTY